MLEHLFKSDSLINRGEINERKRYSRENSGETGSRRQNDLKTEMLMKLGL